MIASLFHSSFYSCSGKNEAATRSFLCATPASSAASHQLNVANVYKQWSKNFMVYKEHNTSSVWFANVLFDIIIKVLSSDLISVFFERRPLFLLLSFFCTVISFSQLFFSLLHLFHVVLFLGTLLFHSLCHSLKSSVAVWVAFLLLSSVYLVD